MTTAHSTSIRQLCVLVPFGMYLPLWAMEPRFRETYYDEIGGVLVLTWCVWMAFRMWRSRGVAMSGEYATALKWSLLQHVVVFLLAALMLDAGLTGRSCLLAGILYWMIIGMVIVRRPSCPSRSDVAVVSSGFLCLAFFVSSVAWCVTIGAPDLLI
jgi:hypothetical protein